VRSTWNAGLAEENFGAAGTCFVSTSSTFKDEGIHKKNTAPTFFAGDVHAKGMVTMDRWIVRTNKK
jgi:hypothetical protein